MEFSTRSLLEHCSPDFTALGRLGGDIEVSNSCGIGDEADQTGMANVRTSILHVLITD